MTEYSKLCDLNPDEMTPTSIVNGELSAFLRAYREEFEDELMTVNVEISIQKEGECETFFGAGEWFNDIATALHNTELATAYALCVVVSHDPDGTRNGYFNITTDPESFFDLAIEIADLLTANPDNPSESTEATWGEDENHKASFTITNGNVVWKRWIE